MKKFTCSVQKKKLATDRFLQERERETERAREQRRRNIEDEKAKSNKIAAN